MQIIATLQGIKNVFCHYAAIQRTDLSLMRTTHPTSRRRPMSGTSNYSRVSSIDQLSSRPNASHLSALRCRQRMVVSMAYLTVSFMLVCRMTRHSLIECLEDGGVDAPV